MSKRKFDGRGNVPHRSTTEFFILMCVKSTKLRKTLALKAHRQQQNMHQHLLIKSCQLHWRQHPWPLVLLALPWKYCEDTRHECHTKSQQIPSALQNTLLCLKLSYHYWFCRNICRLFTWQILQSVRLPSRHWISSKRWGGGNFRADSTEVFWPAAALEHFLTSIGWSHACRSRSSIQRMLT